MKVHKQFFRLMFFALVFFLGHSLAPAQESSGTGIGTKSTPNGFYLPEDDTKGSVVRGRVFYQNTGKPLRRGWISLRKIRELVEPKSDDTTAKMKTVRSYGNEKYVLTNDEGEFVMKGVKAGIYLPLIQVQGILNPGYDERESPNFQQIIVDGTSEIQTNIAVQRGGAISGRVLYADGEPVIGAKMQILIKKDERFTPYFGDQLRNNSSITDDLGFYRFAALPANEYVIFAAEPSVQNGSDSSTFGYNINSSNDDSVLKTFYPNAAEVKDAKPLNVFPGQELSDTNLIVPDHRLFKISGLAVTKNNNVPLKDIQVSFQKISENININYGSNQSKQTKTDAQGNWTLIDLPAGKYRVTAASKSSNDYDRNQPKPVDNQPKYAPVSKEIEIGNENLTDVLFELSMQATISGTVTVEGGKPLPDYVSLGAFEEENKSNSFAYLNNKINNQMQKPNNEFRIEGLSGGKYFLTASSGGKYFAKSITLKNSDAKNTPIEIKDGENIEGVQIVLSADSGIVKGIINNYKKEGRVGIVLIPSGKSPMFALRSIGGEGSPKANGDFEFDAAPGEYFAVIITEANRPKSEANLDEWLKKLVKDAPKITVKKGETTNINLDYPM